jgi:hypothetical protein
VEALKTALAEGGSWGKKQKVSHDGSYSTQGAFAGGQTTAEENGEKPLSEEEEREVAQNIQSKLFSPEPGKIHLPK